jgi:hypothetical protein
LGLADGVHRLVHREHNAGVSDGVFEYQSTVRCPSWHTRMQRATEGFHCLPIRAVSPIVFAHTLFNSIMAASRSLWVIVSLALSWARPAVGQNDKILADSCLVDLTVAPSVPGSRSLPIHGGIYYIPPPPPYLAVSGFLMMLSAVCLELILLGYLLKVCLFDLSIID